jgi:hypothetical protein
MLCFHLLVNGKHYTNRIFHTVLFQSSSQKLIHLVRIKTTGNAQYSCNVNT